MINQLISMAAWKGMSQKQFPLWTLINAYNQQPDRLMEMTRAGFFPTEQGPMPLGRPNSLPAQGTQPISIVDEHGVTHTGTLHQPEPQSHDAQLLAEIKALRGEFKQMVKHNTQNHRRIKALEERARQIPSVATP